MPQRRPWGWAIGLAAASATILIGVARGLAPEVILLRAALAGAACGAIARLVRVLIGRLGEKA